MLNKNQVLITLGVLGMVIACVDEQPLSPTARPTNSKTASDQGIDPNGISWPKSQLQASAGTSPSEIKAVQSSRRLALVRTATGDTLLVQNAAADKRPYLHPLLAPDGKGTLTENSPSHHPWQHGLYVGLNQVEGVGFWTEGPTDGTFHPEPLEAAYFIGPSVRWSVKTEWRNPQGTPWLMEIQTWTFTDLGNRYTLDLEWTLTASRDLTFGKYDYGGLFLRMPFRGGTVAQAVNSEGFVNLNASAKRSKWVSLSMPLPDRNGGSLVAMAILEHPSNPGFPNPWRVDNELGISPSHCILGEWKLKQGESSVSRYRVFAYLGKNDSTEVEKEFQSFSTPITTAIRNLYP